MARAENFNVSALKQARESAGLGIEEAAERLGINPPRLELFESGDESPTRVQLLKIAAVYRRPLTTFYLANWPGAASRGEDFRTLRGPVSRKDNAALDALLRDIRARQDMVRSAVDDEEDWPKADFVGSARLSDSVPSVARRIRERLGFASDRQPTFAADPTGLFRDLRARVEGLGVFVILAGDLGSYRSVIGENVFRGFAISDPIAPFIVINDQDAKPAYSFTLLHELVHIFLGITGVSGEPTASDKPAETREAKVERFCNDVASEVLLPAEFLPAAASLAQRDDVDLIHEVAGVWNVSEPLVAYRLHRVGRIASTRYDELCAIYASRWRQRRSEIKQENRETEGGPSFYTIKKYRLGQALVALVHRQVRSDAMTHSKAAKVLGVRAPTVEPLLRSFEQPPKRSRL